MNLVAACLWGLGGAAAIESLDLYKAIRRTKDYPWRHPDEVPLGPYILSVVIRIALGAIAAGACSASSQIAGPAGALAAGFAAPKLFEQLSRLPDTEHRHEYIKSSQKTSSIPNNSEEATKLTAKMEDAAPVLAMGDSGDQ